MAVIQRATRDEVDFTGFGAGTTGQLILRERGLYHGLVHGLFATGPATFVAADLENYSLFFNAKRIWDVSGAFMRERQLYDRNNDLDVSGILFADFQEIGLKGQSNDFRSSVNMGGNGLDSMTVKAKGALSISADESFVNNQSQVGSQLVDERGGPLGTGLIRRIETLNITGLVDGTLDIPRLFDGGFDVEKQFLRRLWLKQDIAKMTKIEIKDGSDTQWDLIPVRHRAEQDTFKGYSVPTTYFCIDPLVGDYPGGRFDLSQFSDPRLRITFVNTPVASMEIVAEYDGVFRP